MEFMDIDLLKPGAAGHTIPAFEELKRSDKVAVTMDLRPADDAHGLAALARAMDSGWAVAGIAKKPPPRNFLGRTDFPRRVMLEMTSVCNVLCRMCPRNHLLRPVMHANAGTYCRVLDELDAYGVEGVWTYHLGESLLHPEFRRILCYMEKLGNLGTVWMSTNGHLLNESNLAFILDSRIDYLNFSLHAASEAAYRAVVPRGDFSVVSRNYGRMATWKRRNRGKRPVVHLQMIEQEATRSETEAFLAAHYREVEIVSISMLEYVHLPNNGFGLRQRRRKEKRGCTRVQRGDCFVLSDGSVTLCDAVQNNDEAHAGLLYLGNVHEDSLYQIWNGSRRQQVLEMEREGRLFEIAACQECSDYDL